MNCKGFRSLSWPNRGTILAFASEHHENLSQVLRCSSQDSNRAPSKYHQHRYRYAVRFGGRIVMCKQDYTEMLLEDTSCQSEAPYVMRSSNPGYFKKKDLLMFRSQVFAQVTTYSFDMYRRVYTPSKCLMIYTKENHV
jgi:hypothetical protein